MTTTLFYPDKLTKKIFQNDKKIIFFDNFGYQKFNAKKKARELFSPDLNEEDFKIFKDYDETELITIIRSWGPAISRFIDRGDQYELEIRNILIKFYEISSFLLREKINLAIMFTASPHHLSSLIFDLACRKNKTKLIYLENLNSIISGSPNLLIPFLHSKKFMEKKVINCNFSDFDVTNELKRVIKNLDVWKKKKYIRIRHIDEFFYSKNYLLSSIRIFIHYSYLKLRKILNITNTKYFDLNNYSVLTHLKQAFSQYKSIQYYKKKSSNLFFINKIKKKSLLIVANYQPEGTSYPEGKENNNHIDIISKIRAKGYRGTIYYKEHYDSQFFYLDVIQSTKVGIARSKKYYQDLEKLGCKFLPFNFSLQNKKYRNYFLPITICGTIAVERSLLGYNTIICGYPWYKGLPGTYHINNIDLKNLNLSIFKNSTKVKKNSFNYLKKIINKKTIINYPGTGGLQKMLSDDNEKEYKNKILKITKLFDIK